MNREGNIQQTALRIPPRTLKYLTTFGICFGNLCMATAMSCYGPSLVYFKNKYGTSMDDISVVVTIMTIGYLGGSLATMFAYKFLRRQLGVILLMSGAGTAMFLTPHCPTKSHLFGVGGLLGFSCGAYDASQLVWVMEMWQAEAGPFIQTSQFFYALGGILAPLNLAPFLASPVPDLCLPFTAVGLLTTGAVGWQVYLIIFRPYYAPPPEAGRVEAEELPLLSGSPVPRSKSRRILLIVLSAVFLGADQGMEMCTFSFISAFTQYGVLRLSESQGAYILSGTFGALLAGRGLGILASLKVQPQWILCANLVFVAGANGILRLFGNTSVSLVWLGMVGLGLGFSTINPAYCAYIERHLLFTNAVGSIMLISGSSFASIYPLVVGKYMEGNPMVLTYTNYFSLGWMVLAAVFLVKLTYKNKR